MERPSDDSERIETLLSLSVLDTQLDPKFEDITRLVTTIFNAPIAAVTIVDRERLFFMSLQGLQYSNREMDRNEACFDSYAVAQKDNEVLVVENAAEDARLDNFSVLSVHYASTYSFIHSFIRSFLPSWVHSCVRSCSRL